MNVAGRPEKIFTAVHIGHNVQDSRSRSRSPSPSPSPSPTECVVSSSTSGVVTVKGADEISYTADKVFPPPDAAGLKLEDYVFSQVADPCIVEFLSANCLLLGSARGTDKAARLFGNADGEGSFFVNLLAQVFKKVEDLKADNVEYLVVVSLYAIHNHGRTAGEVVDLLRQSMKRGPKCLITREQSSGFPIVSNLTRVALNNEDEFNEHWNRALQRLRVSVLPQTEGANDPCAANFVVNIDVEQMKTTPKGSHIYRTATLRFANFCDPLASPGSTLADVASAGGGNDALPPSRALASLVEHLGADEATSRRACDDILASCPVLQLLRPSLGGSARCCVLAFVGDTEDAVDHTVHQLQLMKTFTMLQNTPVSRGQTSTLLQELREEKSRLLEKMKRENREFNAAKEQDIEHQQEQRQTALQRRLAQKKAEAEKREQLKENERRAREAAEKAAAEQGITVEELLKTKVITKVIEKEKVVEKEVLKEIIEEKVVGPSDEELHAARQEGLAAMQDRNAKIAAAQEAEAQIREHEEKSKAAAEESRRLKMKLISQASHEFLVDSEGRVLDMDEIDVGAILQRQKAKLNGVQRELKACKANCKSWRQKVELAQRDLLDVKQRVKQAQDDSEKGAKSKLKAGLQAQVDSLKAAQKKLNATYRSQMKSKCRKRPENAQHLNLLQVLAADFLTKGEFDELDLLRARSTPSLSGRLQYQLPDFTAVKYTPNPRLGTGTRSSSPLSASLGSTIGGESISGLREDNSERLKADAKRYEKSTKKAVAEMRELVSKCKNLKALLYYAAEKIQNMDQSAALGIISEATAIVAPLAKQQSSSSRSSDDSKRGKSRRKAASEGTIAGVGGAAAGFDVSEKHIKRLFKYLDGNGNGTIEMKELRNFYKRKQKMSDREAKAEAKQDVAHFDTDADGKISYEEFTSGIQRLGAAASTWLSEKLAIMEERKKGSRGSRSATQPAEKIAMELDELMGDEESKASPSSDNKKSLSKSKTSLKEMNEFNKLISKTFRRMDKNGDGVLSPSEIKRTLKKARGLDESQRDIVTSFVAQIAELGEVTKDKFLRLVLKQGDGGTQVVTMIRSVM